MFLDITKCVMAAAVMLSISAHADETYSCQKDGSVREIRVAYEVEGEEVPCSVIYVKNDSEAVLWSAQAQIGYCEEKASSFAEKQRGWGWDCSSEGSAGDEEKVEEVVEESVDDTEAAN